MSGATTGPEAGPWVGETVHVVDDDEAVLKSSRALLESVGLRPETYESPAQFLARIDSEMSGCVVMDLRMPGMSGLDLLQEAKKKGMALPVLFITGYGEVPSAVNAMRAGAVDFLEKPVDHRQLLEKIYEALERGSEQSRTRDRHRTIVERAESLTPRETEVALLVGDGKTSKAIGAALGISAKTVEVHRGKIIEKMQVKNSVELVRLIVESGLFTDEDT